MNWRNHLGEVVSELYRLGSDTISAHEDISLWGAPGECHADENKGYEMAVSDLRRSKLGGIGIGIHETDVWL